MPPYTKEQLKSFLAPNLRDASNGILFSAGGSIEPDSVNRTILIGLGGTGVRTINAIKAAVHSNLMPTWTHYISFLGIDTDWNEFDSAHFLTDDEKLMITNSTVNQRGVNPAHRSIAQKRLVPNEQSLPSCDGPGAGQRRQYGAFKIHDQTAGAPGYDEQIMQKISNKANSMDPLSPATPGAYEVYVIGSVCGGTCSGSFPELPAIIERALTGKKYRARAILYLPDICQSLDPPSKHHMNANGYASLKELDYYMGATMRGAGYTDTWGINITGSPETKLPPENDPEKAFFKLPYLIGTPNPGANGAREKATQMVVQHLLSLLGKMTPSSADKNAPMTIESQFDNAQHNVDKRMYANPVTRDEELPGENHERPRVYKALGYAEAAAPEQIIRAYTVGGICERAGLKCAASVEQRAVRKAHEEIVPFRSETDLFGAREGTNRAREMLSPFANLLKDIHGGKYSIIGDYEEVADAVTWNKIHDGNYKNQTAQQSYTNMVNARTSTHEMEELAEKFRKAYNSFKTNVKDFVASEGPYAFVNLYKGAFIPEENNPGRGIEAMLRSLCEGNELTGNEYRWMSEHAARTELENLETVIADTGKITGALKHNHQRADWISCFDRWMTARINEKRREFAIGNNGALRREILGPASILCDELKIFGDILDNMAGIYCGFRDNMKDFTAFGNARDNETEINLAAVNQNTFNWIKQEADKAVAVANALQFRTKLVEDFFEDPTAWVEIPGGYVTANANGSALTNETKPIPARTKFDQIAADNMPQMNRFSIESMFNHNQLDGIDYGTLASSIVTSLAAQSLPSINANVPVTHVIAVYPQSLTMADAAPIGAAIDAAFRNRFNEDTVGFTIFSSADTAAIRCYQLAAPFEMYKLAELAEWEKDYEDALNDVPTTPGISEGIASYMHCMSPSAEGTMGNTFTEKMPWVDYPSVCLQGDPRIPDAATGKHSREGKRRLKIDEVFAEAEKLGVLYCEEDAGVFLYKRVYCDKRFNWDRPLDIFACEVGDDGTILLGKPLANAVALQHGTSLDAISREVKLNDAGIFAGAAGSKEKAAENAKRVLRAHVPMYLEVLKTLELFKRWAADIEAFNGELLKALRPARMLYLMQASLLDRQDDGAWILRKDGRKTTVANLSKAMMVYLKGLDRKLLDNGMLGYYLFCKIETLLPGKELDKSHEEAVSVYQEMLTNGDADALEHGKALVDEVLAERNALVEKGMQPDEGEEKVTKRFSDYLKGTGITEEDEHKSIQEFYTRVQRFSDLG